MKKLLVILAVIAMVGAFTATSMAAEWNFYGSSRMTTVYYSKSKEVANTATTPTTFDDEDTAWTDQTNARIGAHVKASDTVSGRFEYQSGASAVNLRLLYGTWDFGSGKLMVGQNYTPVDQILSDSIGALAYQISGTAPVADGEGNALTIGSFYESRKPQIGLQFGSLKLAFIKPATATLGAYNDIDTTLPKIEVSYAFKADAFSITPYAGYNTVDVANPANDNDVTVNSYVVGAAGAVNFGPMYLKANLFLAQNPENYGRLNAGMYDGAVLVGTDTEDADLWGGQLIAGYKLSDMIKFEAGYSYDHNELEVGGVTGENDLSHWYVNATITMAPGVMIIPEFGSFDFGDDEAGGVTADRGDATYFGAKWQINF